MQDCFRPERAIVNLEATNQREVIREMVGALVSSGRILADHQDDVANAVMAREELGSTGIGNGIAIPHAKHKAVTDFTGAIGQSKSGVDFGSLDGELVHLVFLLISPPGRPGDQLRMLESLTRAVRHYDARRP